MNQSDFARLHGVSRKTVTMWKSRGWLIMSGDDIDVTASNAQLEKYRKTINRPAKERVEAPVKKSVLPSSSVMTESGKTLILHWRASPEISFWRTVRSYHWMKRVV